MKTAEEIFKKESGCAFEYGAAVVVVELDEAIRLAKTYANKVSEQALKDAANKYEGIHMRDSFGCTCDVPSAILSTPIVTI